MNLAEQSDCTHGLCCRCLQSPASEKPLQQRHQQNLNESDECRNTLTIQRSQPLSRPKGESLPLTQSRGGGSNPNSGCPGVNSCSTSSGSLHCYTEGHPDSDGGECCKSGFSRQATSVACPAAVHGKPLISWQCGGSCAGCSV